jgi:hypothetical protein
MQKGQIDLADAMLTRWIPRTLILLFPAIALGAEAGITTRERATGFVLEDMLFGAQR